MKLSIIVPMLNEIEALPALLEHLLPYRKDGCEVLLVDGGSSDGGDTLADRAGFTVLRSAGGRARQMNTGARTARGDLLLFLHADSQLPLNAEALVRDALAVDGNLWGRFDVNITGQSRILPVIAFCMNQRSRLTGIATGDQGIFVRRSAFEAVGGFPDQLLMEDVELSSRLRRKAPPVCLSTRISTSGRRWEARGVWRTILLMWRLRLAYRLGVTPESLARAYR